jgi:hypothetical protein
MSREKGSKPIHSLSVRAILGKILSLISSGGPPADSIRSDDIDAFLLYLF